MMFRSRVFSPHLVAHDFSCKSQTLRPGALSTKFGSHRTFLRQSDLWLTLTGSFQKVIHTPRVPSPYHPTNDSDRQTAPNQIDTDRLGFGLNNEIIYFKGTAMFFFLSETSMNLLQRQFKLHINRKKQQNSHKIAESMKKEGFWHISKVFLIS